MNDEADAKLAQRLTEFQEHLISDSSPFESLDELSTAEDVGFRRLTRCLTALEMMRRFDEPLDTSTLMNDDALLDDSSPVEKQRIGRFTIERRLGSGGQGYVFRAFDPELDRQVALKLPRPDILLSPALRLRFLDEARFAARLRHPNLVTVYEVGEIGPLCFIASEYCEGCSLAEWLAKAKQPVDALTACRFVFRLADAVSAMHQSQIIHRDLKPSNVLLQITSDRTIDNATLSDFDPKITDFGLARLFDSDSERTRTGALLGTPAYMSPEQARGERTMTGQGTDIHALGVLLYEVLTRISPFQGKSDADTLRRVLEHEFVPLRNLRPDIPHDLEAICHKCLEPSPKARYTTAADLKLDLLHFLDGLPTIARPLTPGQKMIRWCRRRPAMASLAAVTISAGLVIGFGLLFFNIRLQHALDLANKNAVESMAHQREVVRSNERANIQLYGTQMRLASMALDQGDHQRARELIAPYLEGQPLHHLAGFEAPLMSQLTNRVANEGSNGSTRSIIHPDEVYSVDFSPDDKQIATGCRDGFIRIWNAQSRELIHEWKGHASCANCVRYSADGRYLASGGCDNRICVWKRSQDSLPTLLWHAEPDGCPVRHVAFSPNSELVASGGDNNWLRVWDVSSGKQLQQFDSGCTHYERFDWSPDGNKLAVAIRYTTGYIPTRLIDLQTQESKPLGIHGSHVSFSPDGEVLSILDDRGIHHVTLKPTTRPMGSIRLPHLIHAIQWTDDSQYLATLSNVNTLRFDNRSNAELHNIITIDGLKSTDDLALSRDGRMAAVASRAGVVKLATVDSPIYQPTIEIPLELPSSTGLPMTCGIDGLHQSLFVCSKNSIGQMQVGPNPMWSPVKIDSDPQWIRASTSGAYATTIINQTVRLIDVATGNIRQIPPQLTEQVVAAFHFDENNFVVIVDAQNHVRVLDDRTFSIRYETTFDRLGNPEFLIPYVSRDSRFFAYINNWSTLTCVDLRTGTKSTQKGEQFSDAAFLRHTDRIVALSSNAVVMYELPQLKVIGSFRTEHPDGTVCVSPDDKTLAIASKRGVLLTHLATGQEVMRLPMEEPDIKLARFRDDGRALTVLGFHNGDFVIHEWRIDSP